MGISLAHDSSVADAGAPSPFRAHLPFRVASSLHSKGGSRLPPIGPHYRKQFRASALVAAGFSRADFSLSQEKTPYIPHRGKPTLPTPHANIRSVPVDKDALKSNLASIQERVARAAERSGRPVEGIAFVAVSKTFSAEAIRAAHELGLRHFGENRVQEFDSKRQALADLDATFHLIGHLQGNKARRAAEIFDIIDSVDSIALARKLDAAWAEHRKADASKLPILIEVQLAAEESKFGVTEADLPNLIEAILQLPRLELRGLMAIPPFLENPERVRPYFQRLRQLRENMRQRFGAAAADSFRELSMGMSHDFEVAIEEGATQIRVGTALFGARVP